MLLPRLGALLLAASTVDAFKNTSPFFLLSSDPLPQDAPLQSAQIALTKDVEDRLIETLSDCDRKIYHIFSQQRISADDFREGKIPEMQELIQSADAANVVQIPEVMVMGELSLASVARRLEDVCSKKGKKLVDGNIFDPTFKLEGADEYIIVRFLLPHFPSCGEPGVDCFQQMEDAFQDTYALPSRERYSRVLIYITTPPGAPIQGLDGLPYEMDDPYPSALHTDLKRDLHDIRKRQSDNSTDMQHGLGLFETYQFFTPGLFMGLTVSLGLLFILYIGISAIAGLEVSYMAFNKENGPQAQNRGKQQ